jgi:PDGLE domain
MKRRTLVVFSGVALVVAFALAFFVSPYASSEPDAVERVAIDSGFADQAREHALANGPLADYSVSGVDGAGLSTGLAGLIGVALCFVIGLSAVWIARRTHR